MASDKTVQDRIDALGSMRLPELWAEYEEIVGVRTRTPNKTWLIRKMREALCGPAAAHAPEPEPTTPDPTTAEPPPADPQPAIPQLEVEQTPPPPWSRKHVAKKRSKAAAKAAATEATSATEEPEATSATEEPEAQATAPASEAPKAPHAFPQPTTPLAPQIDPPVEPLPAETRLSKLPVSELRARYMEVVGRPTGSTVASYLVWKIREVQKGHLPAGPRAVVVHGAAPSDSKVLPLRVGAKETEAMDAVWRARGFASRMEFLRASIARHLEHLGAEDVAKMFATTSK